MHRRIAATIAKRIKPGSFLANFTILFAGNASAQIITFFSSAAITRIFTPNDFGIMTFVLSTTAVCSALSCLRYETAVILPKQDRDAQDILSLCCLTAGLTTIFFAGAVAVCKSHIARLFGVPEMENWLWFVPPGAFLFGLREALSYWYSRQKKFAILARSRVYIALGTAAAKIFAGIAFTPTALYLILGNLLGIICGTVPLFGKKLDTIRNDIVHGFSLKKIATVAKQYKKFPLFLAWSDLANELSENLPVFFISYYYSPDILGFYALTRMVLYKPIGLIAQSMTKVVLQKLAEAHAHGRRIDGAFTRLTKNLTLAGLVPVAILLIGGPWIFSLCFGSQWHTAGQYAQILTPILLSRFFIYPANQVIIIYQKLRFKFIYHLCISAAQALSFWGSQRVSDDPTVALLIYSISTFVFCAIYLWVAFVTVRPKEGTGQNSAGTSA